MATIKKPMKKAQNGTREQMLAAMNTAAKTYKPQQALADKARQDSLAKANRPTWLGAVDSANMDVAAVKKPVVKQKDGGKTSKSKKNWIQDVSKSIKSRGTEGKCTPITKPGCTGRAKALAKTFKKMATKRKGK